MRRLPNITDEKLLYDIANLQYQRGFKEYHEWLFGEAKQHVVNKMVDAKEDSEMRNYQGALQLLKDQEQLFIEAKESNLKL